ncbi:MAG TPA: TPM domain-containing protein [Blastocatellia bacterium]|nr:TPM domain-containing protein [Blastocatellia bacterium]
MNRLRKSALVLCAVFACASILPVLAQQRQFPAYSGHVNDFANVLDAATKEQLETILLNFERLTGTQIAVVTVTTLGERPIEEYANELYRAWGVGAKSGPNRDKGAMLLIATEDRRSRLEVGYGLEGDLPDGLAGEMLRRMRPYFRQQQWSEGVTIGVRTLVDTLAQKWNVSLEGIDRRYAYQEPASRPGTNTGGAITMIFFFILMIVIISAIARSNRRGGGRWGRGGGIPSVVWWGPLIFNRGGGGFGGGSWGNSGGWGGGGGGWGGFGGGSSGGGGASDSW